MANNFDDAKANDFKEHLEKCGIETIQIFTTQNYGPFDYLNELCPSNALEHDSFISRFKDGVYAIATVKNDESLPLYHLDETRNRIRVSKPIKFLVGRTNDSGNKSSLMIYMPKQYVSLLKKAFKSGDQFDMDYAIKVQDLFYASFNRRLYKLSKAYIEAYYSKRRNLRQLALSGNRRDRMPSELVEAIRKNKISPKSRNFPLGVFEAHREEIELPSGQKKLAILTVTTKYNGSDVKQFKKNNYTISQTTENFSIFYNLSIK